jgi:predicted nucleic acid-binding protein
VIFVDTSFWVALVAARDDRHGAAIGLLDEHGAEHLASSNHVCGETWTFLRKRHGHFAAVRFLDRLDGSDHLRVTTISEALEAEAWRWLRRHDERPYSFVDATSFALMRSLRIRETLTFDDDFEAAGFVALRA